MNRGRVFNRYVFKLYFELSLSSDSDGESLWKLKRVCLHLRHAALLNRQKEQYTKQFANNILDTVTDNLSCAVVIAGKMLGHPSSTLTTSNSAP